MAQYRIIEAGHIDGIAVLQVTIEGVVVLENVTISEANAYVVKSLNLAVENTITEEYKNGETMQYRSIDSFLAEYYANNE